MGRLNSFVTKCLAQGESVAVLRPISNHMALRPEGDSRRSIEFDSGMSCIRELPTLCRRARRFMILSALQQRWRGVGLTRDRFT